MIEAGDIINFRAVCINRHAEGYCFVLEEGPIKENFNIKFSENDANYNQQVEAILEKWIVR